MFPAICFCVKANRRQWDQTVIKKKDNVGPLVSDYKPFAMIKPLNILSMQARSFLKRCIDDDRYFPGQVDRWLAIRYSCWIVWPASSIIRRVYKRQGPDDFLKTCWISICSISQIQRLPYKSACWMRSLKRSHMLMQPFSISVWCWVFDLPIGKMCCNSYPLRCRNLSTAQAGQF